MKTPQAYATINGGVLLVAMTFTVLSTLSTRPSRSNGANCYVFVNLLYGCVLLLACVQLQLEIIFLHVMLGTAAAI